TSEPEAPAPAPVKEEAVQKVAPPAPTAVDEQIIITPEEQRVAEAFNQTEQARLQGTIRQLREEREELLKEIHELKTESKLGDQDKLGLRAELDEARIEIQILKKRNHDEIDELKYRVRLSEEKKHIYEERAKSIQKEFDRLNQKVRIDINQVKQREKELESQLELISMDSQSQVKSRDMKILDLKRKIDSLEFNMENASIREVKSREDKEKVEERLEKIMRTLRGSLKSLESDNDLDDGILDKIDKL
ncbi:MAG: chromosome segregation ATPase, partial [Bacteriovoracaceae bacterium]